MLGTYHSLTLKQPPFPFNPFPELPVTQIKPGVYVYDDRSVDYLALRAELAAVAEFKTLALAPQEEGSGGGGMMLMMSAGETNLGLTIPVIQGNLVYLSIVNANTNEPYDMFSTKTVGTTNAWDYLGRLPSGTTNFSVGLVNPTAAAQSVTFNTANTYDSDGDSLSDALENLVTQTDPNTPDDTNSVPPGTIGFELLVDPPPLVRVKQYDRDWRFMVYFSFGSEEGGFGTNHWVRGIGGGGADFDVLYGFPPAVLLRDSVSWDGLGNPTPSTSPSMPPNPWRHRRALETTVEGLPDNYTATYVAEDNITTKIELLTGGRALSTTENLVVLTITARDQDAWYPAEQTSDIAVIPPEDITVLGEHPDADDRLWKMLADSQTLDVTPVVPASHTNYAFTVSATKLKLKIMRNGEDIAGKKQIVWVGQPINLTCELDNSSFTISNFTWTVPGNSISNYVYTTETAEVVTQYPKTKASVGYYWIQDLASGDVTVTATLNGFTLQAKVLFEVRRPSATLRLTPKWQVEVSTDFCGYLQGTGVPRLQTGKKCTTNDVGMLYEFILQDLKGFQSDYEFQMVQIVTTDIKRNLPEVNGVRNSQEVLIRGLDAIYPYKSWAGPSEYGYADDTPHELLFDVLWVYHYRRDQFECHLMFKPSGGIPVPIKLAAWNWKGQAAYQSNPAGWYGVVPYVHPQPALGVENLSYPTWTNNAGNWINFMKTNPFWFVP